MFDTESLLHFISIFSWLQTIESVTTSHYILHSFFHDKIPVAHGKEEAPGAQTVTAAD